MLSGEHDVTLDEKGRIMIPAKLRSQIAGNVLWVTKAPDQNLWLYTPEEWEKVSANVMSNLSPFSSQAREVLRNFITPAQELEIDKVGRILIPPSLKAYAQLKKEVRVSGAIKFIELWDVEIYASHMQESKERGDYEEAQKILEERIFF